MAVLATRETIKDYSEEIHRMHNFVVKHLPDKEEHHQDMISELVSPSLQTYCQNNFPNMFNIKQGKPNWIKVRKELLHILAAAK